MTPIIQNQPVISDDSDSSYRFQSRPPGIAPPPRGKSFSGQNNIDTIESREYSTGVSLGVFRSNNEVRHSLDSTLIRSLVNQGVVGSGQFSTYYLYFCKNRTSCLCLFRMIERREQFSGNSVFSVLEGHSVECVHSETRHRKGEISEAEFFPKDILDVASDKGNRGGMIIIHKGKVHRNKGRSSSEYRRFFCKENNCSHRIIERKNDGMVCVRGYHDCMSERSPKKSSVKFFSKEELCVSITNGHLKGGKPAKNLICNGCLFLSNRKNVVLGGRKFEENTVANEYICQIKNQFKRNRNRDRSDFHCNAIVKERTSDGRIILQGHHDPLCLQHAKKFYAPEVHQIKAEEGESISVYGIPFYPLSTRSMKFGKEEISVMEYMCSLKTSFSHIGCSAVVFKHLEYDTYFLTGRHDPLCMQKNKEKSKRVLPNLRILSPPTPLLHGPPSSAHPVMVNKPPPPLPSSSMNIKQQDKKEIQSDEDEDEDDEEEEEEEEEDNSRRNRRRRRQRRGKKPSKSLSPPLPPPSQKKKKASGRSTRNSQRRSIINSRNKDPNQISIESKRRNGNGNNHHHHGQIQYNHNQQQNSYLNRGFMGPMKPPAPRIMNVVTRPSQSSYIPELRIMSVYPGIVERPGSTINILIKCPPNLAHLIQPNLFTLYFTESVSSNNSPPSPPIRGMGKSPPYHPHQGQQGGPRIEVIPRSTFYFPSIQFSDHIGNEWGVGGATCRIVVTMPFFFGLSGLLNMRLELPNNIGLEMKNALMVSSNVNHRQNMIETRENDSKKRKLVDILLPANERDSHHRIAKNGSNMRNILPQIRNSRICCFLPNKPQSPKINYAEIFMSVSADDELENMDDIEIYFNDDQATVLGTFEHIFGGKHNTRFSKMYKSVYEENCKDSNLVVTVEVPNFIIDSESIDLVVILINRKKNVRKRMVIKNVFQVDGEEARKDPFLMTLNSVERNSDVDVQLTGDFENLNIFRPETPPMLSKGGQMINFNAGAGFNRVESFDDFDTLGVDI